MYRPHIALAGILLGAALLSGGCAKDTPATTPPADEDASVGHIHGLGVDPADDSLYVATHFGLFHVGYALAVFCSRNPEAVPAE